MSSEFLEEWKEKFFKIDSRRLYIISFSIRLFLLGFFGESWDIYVFLTATKQFVFEGITPYRVALQRPPYIYMPFYPYIENWYAYPPLMLLIFSVFYSFYLIWPIKAPFFERFFIKMPIALGDLLLSWFLGKLIFELTGDKRKARHAELSILLNPFFILISSVWGMFDSLSLSFLVLSLIYLLREEDVKGSVTYSVSVLIKQTTLFAAPILFFFWLKYRGLRRTMQYVTLSFTVFLLVSAPFLLDTPTGYLQQVLMLHVNRPPWGYNIFTAIYFLLVYLESGLIIGNRLFSLSFLALVSALSLSLVATTILFLGYSYYRKREAQPSDIIYYLLLAYFTFIFLNKVTNEPYFIYLMGFMVAYSLIKNDSVLFREFSSLSYYLLISTLIAAMRFIIFIPYDVLVFFFGPELSEEILQLTPVFGEANPYVVATLAIGAIVIIPTYLSLFNYYLHQVRKEIRVSITPRFLFDVPKSETWRVVFKKLGSYKSVLIIVFLLLFSYQMSSLSSLLVFNGSNEKYIQPGHVVAIHYVWMDNPSHDPSVRAGSWRDAFLTPLEGFYESKTPYMREDLKEIKSAGINAILVEVYLGRSASVTNLADLALEENLTILPYLDIGKLVNISYFDYIRPDIGNGTKLLGFYSLKLDTWTTFLSTILDVADLFTMPNIYEINGTPTLVIDGVSRVYPGFDNDAIDYQISNLYGYFNITDKNTTKLLDLLSKRWNVTINSLNDLYDLYPKNISQFLNQTNKIYRDLLGLYVYSFKMFWETLISTIEERETEIFLVLGYENDPLNSLNLELFSELSNETIISRYYGQKMLSNLMINQFYLKQNEILTYGGKRIDVKQTYFIILNTTTGILPLYSIYNSTWSYVATSPGNLTLIFSWNDYKLGSVIEPTLELGYRPLELTKYYVKRLAIGIIDLDMKIEKIREEVLLNDEKR